MTEFQESFLYFTWRTLRRHAEAANTPFFEAWRSFEHFRRDLGVAPEGCALSRTNHDGPYNPENCRWRPIRGSDADTRKYAEWVRKDAIRLYDSGLGIQDISQALGVPRGTLYEWIEPNRRGRRRRPRDLAELLKEIEREREELRQACAQRKLERARVS